MFVLKNFKMFNNKKITIFPKIISLFQKQCSTVVAKPYESIPGPLSLPLIGTTYTYLPLIGDYKPTRMHINGMKKYLKYGPIVKEEVSGVRIVSIFEPDDIQLMYKQDGKYPNRRSHLALEKYRLDRPEVYNTGGLLPTNGPKWWSLRRIFQKGLSSPVAVTKFIPNTNEIVDEFLERIHTLKNETNYDYLPEISRLFFEITCMSVFDARMNSFSEQELKKNSKSTKLLTSAFVTNSCILKLDHGWQLWKYFETPLYRKLKKAQIFMEEVAMELLTWKLEIYNERKEDQGPSLLDSYFSSTDIDFKDVTGVTCDFLLAGMDTTSYTTTFILYHLALNQEAQEKLYQESLRLLPTPNSPVDKDILENALYNRACVNESQRLRPISFGIGRYVTKKIVLGGYEIPEETVIIAQNQVACRLEKNYPRANEFIPERWLKDDPNYVSTNPFLNLPFGHGNRACIARRLASQNMHILVLKIVRNYKIHWNGGVLDSESYLVNKPDGPALFSFEKR